MVILGILRGLGDLISVVLDVKGILKIKGVQMVNVNKVFLFVLLSFLLVNLVVAFEFDNVKSYNSDTREITITNMFGLGSDLIKARLETPINLKVGIGYQKVAEIKITGFSDYQELIKNLEFYDVRKENLKIDRDYDFMLKTAEQVLVNDYDEVCVYDDKTHNETCTNKIVGEHYETVPSWSKLNLVDINKDEVLVIGIFTDVRKDDIIEWIPMIGGLRIEEWATWTADLNTNLISYYKLDDTLGDVIDSTGNYNCTNNGATRGIIGKIDNSFYFGASNYVNNVDFPNMTDSMTMCAWLNFTGIESNQYVIGRWDGGNEQWLLGGTEGKLRFCINTAGGTKCSGYGEGYNNSQWHLWCVRANTTNVLLNVDGTSTFSVGNTYAGNLDNSNQPLNFGNPDGLSDYIGMIDEVGIWNRSLTNEEITQIWNDGDGMTYALIGANIYYITPPTPIDFANVTTASINITVNVTYTNTNLINISYDLYNYNGTIETKFYTNETYAVNFTLSEANYYYNVTICVNDTLGDVYCDSTDTRHISYDVSEPIIYVSSGNGTQSYGSLSINHTINFTVTDSNLDSCWYDSIDNFNDNDWINGSNYYYNNLTKEGYIGFGVSGVHDIGATNYVPEGWAFNELTLTTGYWSELQDTELCDFSLLTSRPLVYWSDNKYVCLRTVSHGNFVIKFLSDSEWIYKSLNKSIDCSSGVQSSLSIPINNSIFNLYLYANDTVGNLAIHSVNWSYKIIENSQTYNSETIGGSIENYSANLTISPDIEITSAIFYYSNLTETASIYASGQERILEIDDFQVPSYAIETNVSFYWGLTLSDGSIINISSNNQTIIMALIDDCSVYTNQLLNLSLFDEATKTPINGTVELLFQIQNIPIYTTIQTLSNEFEDLHNILICSENNFTGKNLAYSAEIRYYADGYVTELYYIQRADIDDLDTINLFILNESSSTQFVATYENSDFIEVEGAVLQLQRKYIAEDSFEVVEAPLTSRDGKAILHVDLDSNNYKITVVKNGELLDIFENIVFSCQNELSGECTHKLSGAVDPQNDVNIETINNFAYSISDIGNKIVITFSIPSGISSSINVQLTQLDMFGNESLCNKTVISSAGSIECTYNNNTITESYLNLRILKDGIPQVVKTYFVKASDGINFFNNNFIIVFVFMLSIIGMAFTSPEWIVVNGIIVIMISASLWLLNGLNFVMGLGGLAWLVLASGIIIYKMAQQEDK